ncbi:ankyrin repeat-containing domain protein, partial [Massariosphaeria phaeospora]
NYGETPLYLAIRRRNYAFIEILLSRNVKVNISNNAGVSPLHVAVAKGMNSVVKQLCKMSANANAGTSSKRRINPLMIAIVNLQSVLSLKF